MKGSFKTKMKRLCMYEKVERIAYNNLMSEVQGINLRIKL